MPNARFVLAAFAATVSLTACTQSPVKSSENGVSQLTPRVAASQPKLVGAESTDSAEKLAEATKKAATAPFVSLGTGDFVNRQIMRRPPAAEAEKGPTLSLNLENGDVRELVKNVIVDTLQENVIVDPRVTGTVTIRTPKGLARNELIPVLDALLRSVGFMLLKDGNLWRVLPAAEAVQGTTTPRVNYRAVGPGASVVILPVRWVGAKELQRLMAPFAKNPEASIRVDEIRNLLFLFGTETEIKHLLEIAEMFDVDLLSGMSFVIYPLQSAEVKTVVADWERIFPAAGNPLAGLVRLVPIERMNALLVISPNPDVIKEAQRMLERLDQGNDAGGGARLYVYNVQYTQAEKLQVTLQQAITGRVNPVPAATVAPGQVQSTLTAPVSPIAGQGLVAPGNTFANPTTPVQTLQANPTIQRPQVAGAANSQASALARNATVIADKDRNALLIVATPSEYAAIEAAIKKLDTPPKQIAIEVQLAQVQLTGDLSLGLQGTFSGKPNSPINRLTSADGSGALSGGGFSYTWQNSAAKALLSTLQSKSQSRLLAAPTLITLDNQKVSFTNGTQVSVRTQSTTASGVTSGTDSYQYINTGLTINLTPRVSGDNVFLEIQQQNSTAIPKKSDSTNPNPDIVQSSQQTTVMVPNGDTMLLGGLFTDSGSFDSAGLPLVSTIPVLGGLFGSQGWNSTRSELVMLVTPRILSSVEDTRGVVDELRGKLKNIEAMIAPVSTATLPASGTLRKERAKAEAESNSNALGEFAKSLRVLGVGATQ
ncbi:MAG: type II secretion system secretin GspD [Burkholderiales bacterium]|nr:type II secretion system secretin GspD [Burkholderiales bacterium]